MLFAVSFALSSGFLHHCSFAVFFTTLQQGSSFAIARSARSTVREAWRVLSAGQAVQVAYDAMVAQDPQLARAEPRLLREEKLFAPWRAKCEERFGGPPPA